MDAEAGLEPATACFRGKGATYYSTRQMAEAQGIEPWRALHGSGLANPHITALSRFHSFRQINNVN